MSLSFTTQYNGTSASVLAAFMASAAGLLKPVLMGANYVHPCGFQIVVAPARGRAVRLSR